VKKVLERGSSLQAASKRVCDSWVPEGKLRDFRVARGTGRGKSAKKKDSKPEGGFSSQKAAFAPISW